MATLTAQFTELELIDLWPVADGSPFPGEVDAGDDDEDFDDRAEDEDDLREIRTSDDLGEPDPEDDDHLPDDDLQ